MESETKFSVMASLFNWIQKSRNSAKKRSKFRKFIDNFCRPEGYFDAVRLILPGLDRQRGSYGLKEQVLATCLIEALAISRDSQDARKLINWRKGGPSTGPNVGNFALVANEVLQRRQGMTTGELTIKELNSLLDQLASSEIRTEKANILSELIKKTNAQEMKWIIMIILKDLKLGISEKSIFHEFHPDAEDLFNVTCDLKLVCEKLWDRSQRHKRQDIEVGQPVRPQLALRVGNAAVAWKKLHGKEVVVECKFDGDRIQIHKNGSEIHYFSRNFLDHPEYGHAMSNIIMENVVSERCILDGEMLVWDTSTNRFAEFGSNQGIAKAAQEGFDSDQQLCYVAFDILYVGDTSVIHQNLKERHELLRKFVTPIKGHLEILIPNGGLNASYPSGHTGEPCWSLIARKIDDVENFFKETIENRDEGIVLKDLGSKWEPSDRSGKWLKLKPEYVKASSDLDVLIIGGYYGSGRRGGQVAQFLVGLAERSAPNTHPRRFITFCRVGTGLSDEELDIVVDKLKPYFRKYEYPKKPPPSFYQVTNNSKERPDVWIESPEKSIIVSITSDIRTIRSEVFVAPYSLRFPRIDQVRYDKPWHECLDVQSFVELVHSSNGTTQRGADYEIMQDDKSKPIRSLRKGDKKNAPIVPSHFVRTDVSHIKGETRIFLNMMFYFINVPATHTLKALHQMVVENGGTFSMNLNNSVTHCIAAESKGIKFEAAKRRGDIIHYCWLFDCCSQKKLIALQPKYFIFLSDSTKKKLDEEIDEFSDSYFLDLDLADMKQLLSNINRSEDTKIVEYYRKKYCPDDKWSYFHGCSIYFHLPIPSLTSDWTTLLEFAMRRLKLEVSFRGGKVSNNLCQSTHLVVMSLPEFGVDFNSILNSLSTGELRLLHNQRLHVVGSQWLEDCLDQHHRMQEESYTLKSNSFGELAVGALRTCDHNPEEHSALDNSVKYNVPSCPDNDGRQRKTELSAVNPRIITLPKRTEKRKRGRLVSSNTNRERKRVIQPRRVRPRVATKAAKIQENESDTNASEDENIVKEEIEMEQEKHDNYETADRGSAKVHLCEVVEDLDSSQRNRAVEQEVGECAERNIQYDELETQPGEEVGIRNDDTVDKLEVMVDPVHSMLLDMIPSLGTQKVDCVDPIVRDEKLSVDPNPQPLKKKKVSYKDVAGELLKDW